MTHPDKPKLVTLTNCHICGSGSFSELVQAGEWTFQSCDNCSFIFLNPRPAKEFYTELYSPLAQYEYKVNGVEYYKMKDDFIQAYHRQLEQLERLVDRGRILEVGSALGFFLESSRQRGWVPFGIELSPAGANYCREVFGIDVFCGELQDARIASGYFDCVVSIHTLEHVCDPKAFIAEANRVLRTGGLLALEVPYLANPLTLDAPVLTQDLPAHLSIFTTDTLTRLLSDEGFVPVEVQEGEHLRIIAKKGVSRAHAIHGFTPTIYEAIIKLGERLYHRNLLKDSIACFRILCEAYPDEPEAWNNLGTVCWAMGKRESALKMFVKSLAIDERYWNGLFNLVLCAKETGDEKDAALFVERYTANHPAASEVRKILSSAMNEEQGK